MYYLDAGTTYSKIISDKNSLSEEFFQFKKNNFYYYILPSAIIKTLDIKPVATCGHMSFANENEIVALTYGAQKKGIDKNATLLDLGSRDAKWISFIDGKFHDMDWNTSCASSTGATIEMILKFYNLTANDLVYDKDKFSVTCGIFGIEKIMDSISNGNEPRKAISKFVHGIAFNSWNFAKRPSKIYLSGGFCENKCFVDSLKEYTEVELLGRFILCEGLIK